MKKEKKYSLGKRLLAALACILFLGASIATFFVGLSAVIASLFVGSVVIVCGSAATEGVAGILEFVVVVMEMMVEGIVLLLDAIASLFSGLG